MAASLVFRPRMNCGLPEKTHSSGLKTIKFLYFPWKAVDHSILIGDPIQPISMGFHGFYRLARIDSRVVLGVVKAINLARIGGFETRHLTLNFSTFRGKPQSSSY